jgi:hypothetical protein
VPKDLLDIFGGQPLKNGQNSDPNQLRRDTMVSATQEFDFGFQ